MLLAVFGKSYSTHFGNPVAHRALLSLPQDSVPRGALKMFSPSDVIFVVTFCSWELLTLLILLIEWCGQEDNMRGFYEASVCMMFLIYFFFGLLAMVSSYSGYTFPAVIFLIIMMFQKIEVVERGVKCIREKLGYADGDDEDTTAPGHQSADDQELIEVVVLP